MKYVIIGGVAALRLPLDEGGVKDEIWRLFGV